VDFNPDQYLSDFDPDAYVAGDISQEKRNLGRKAWDALAIPEAMSREGLSQLAEMIPKPEPIGNIAADLVRGTPRIIADTVAEAAPGFISRGSIITAGAAKGAQSVAPLARAAGRGLANQLDSLTGAKPGAIGAAWNDASTIFSKSKKTVGQMYGQAGSEGMTLKDELAASPIFGGPAKSNLAIVRAARKSLDAGTLSPGEAFEARKAADALRGSKSVNQTQLLRDRSAFDDLAKTDEAIAKADPAFQKAVFGESLRQVFPQNKYGGTSAFKTGIITALEQMGGIGRLLGALMSPAAVGSLATAGGLASKAIGPILSNPGATVTARQALISQLVTKEKPNEY
jgi:hypothetical protein